MKHFIIGILLTAYGLSLMGPLLPLLDYGLRYDYYAEVLCENKDKPELHCNGTCKLAQMLKAQEEATHDPVHTMSEPLILGMDVPQVCCQTCASPFILRAYNPVSNEVIADQWTGDCLVPPPWIG